MYYYIIDLLLARNCMLYRISHALCGVQKVSRTFSLWSFSCERDYYRAIWSHLARVNIITVILWTGNEINEKGNMFRNGIPQHKVENILRTCLLLNWEYVFQFNVSPLTNHPRKVSKKWYHEKKTEFSMSFSCTHSLSFSTGRVNKFGTPPPQPLMPCRFANYILMTYTAFGVPCNAPLDLYLLWKTHQRSIRKGAP